jgi:hypothetical protein
MPHIQAAAGHFPADGERFGQNIFQRFSVFETFLELLRLLGQCLVGQGREAGFESVDTLDDRAQRFDLAVVFASEDDVQDLGQHADVPLFT